METPSGLSGIWYNQHGSVLKLGLGAGGRISGDFHSHAGLAKPSDSCAVSGYMAGDLVAFVVDFGSFHSLTTWAGHRLWEDSVEVIRACWQMTVKLPMENPVHEDWRGVWTGEDEFRRAPFGVRPASGRLASDPFLYWR